MKRINILMACAALTMAFTGCDDDDPIVLVDSGMTTTDSGTTDPDPDAGTTDPDPDAGMTDTCPPAMAPAPQMPMACAAETLECLMNAGSSAPAQQACLEADPNADACFACLQQDVNYSCTTAAGGCAEQYGEFLCCIEAECAADPTEACAAMAVGDETTPGPCANHVNNLIMCTNAAQGAGACGVSTTCFQPAAP